MSDSVFAFEGPIDESWEQDRLEPDDLDVPNELETAIHDIAEESILREEGEPKDRPVGTGQEAWGDLALEDLLSDAMAEVAATPHPPSNSPTQTST